ncbi:hypothetical protein O7599_13630 [Streptomyces sp. WMMC500]|uniref:hypothetical protein n=1 Tax=Streptomyces sp. WMMC500 TaxID=3015154 RepID=UPI00248BF9DB|nr:hypothetical protein [Streptomyces sp. WMMC500]WBB63494.1 hypothetical protein O7599_13630 [Streptomyces sp. WMMC500]
MAKKNGKLGGLGRWWGVLTFATLIAAWINSAAGPAIVLTLSAATLVWCAFQAPVRCKAPVRGHDDGCRNNAYGMMLGCRQVRAHTYANLRLLFVRRRVREFCSGLFGDAPRAVVTLAGIGSFLSGLVAFVPGLAF